MDAALGQNKVLKVIVRHLTTGIFSDRLVVAWT